MLPDTGTGLAGAPEHATGDPNLATLHRLPQPPDRVLQDGRRTGSGEHTSFTFLGHTFRARGVRTQTGKMMTGFTPAISKDALNRLSAQVRSWGLHRRTGLSEADLARWINPIVRAG
jgi:hypothetical protein